MSTVEGDLFGVGDDARMDVPQVAIPIGFLGHHLSEFWRNNAQNMTRCADNHKGESWTQYNVRFHLLGRSHQSVADEHKIEAWLGQRAV